jgi:hypothetical protein
MVEFQEYTHHGHESDISIRYFSQGLRLWDSGVIHLHVIFFIFSSDLNIQWMYNILRSDWMDV